MEESWRCHRNNTEAPWKHGSLMKAPRESLESALSVPIEAPRKHHEGPRGRNCFHRSSIASTGVPLNSPWKRVLPPDFHENSPWEKVLPREFHENSPWKKMLSRESHGIPTEVPVEETASTGVPWKFPWKRVVLRDFHENFPWKKFLPREFHDNSSWKKILPQESHKIPMKVPVEAPRNHPWEVLTEASASITVQINPHESLHRRETALSPMEFHRRRPWCFHELFHVPRGCSGSASL